jgi:hypothetical protein
MWDLIVLGNIPGTGIYVTFVTWLYIVGAVACAVVLLCLFRTIRRVIMSWRIARIMQQEISHADNAQLALF